MFQNEKPWVSFCMSTYKRPELLKKQLNSLSLQTFTNFEVVVSDNDPENSGRKIVQDLNDPRFKYFGNGVNLGMMQSFNLSIDRADADFIVMITDDDPVEKNFLSDIYNIYKQNNTYGLYAGFLRNNTSPEKIEYIKPEKFAEEILDPAKTKRILWSSCIIKKNIAIEVGKIPDYGSPHLADHAFIIMAGSINGGMVINKMFSTLTSHNTNFSKSNISYYQTGCKGFFETLINFYKNTTRYKYIKIALNKHLRTWFITSIFTLKKHYTIVNKNNTILLEIKDCANSILQLHFMHRNRIKYNLKNLIFFAKRIFNLL
ncbi:MAG: glycosyltransferase family 2 protein [Ginsengibacter sp.]